MIEASDKTWRTELISRESNGVTVRLLWSRATNLVTVAVDDVGSDDYFELVLDEGERALEVFNHPFAHAAARGLEFPTRRPEPEMLRDAA
jgi:hypothetical protein